ncbi:hypothetical protein [Streptomyces sp. NPDC049970]|uniref:hypothetical protein n=1 Tax=Actinomycetes TaxID=1760 RepID=UPI003445D991
MKISTTYRAALSILAPTQALAAEAPACTTENITCLDSQDKPEDSEAKVASAQRAYDRARDDRAAFGQVRSTANDLFNAFEKMETGNDRSQNGGGEGGTRRVRSG